MTSKEEYLKKYLSGSQSSDRNIKKRKKKEKSSVQAVKPAVGLRILDDDIDLERWHGGKTADHGATTRGTEKVLRLPAVNNDDEEFEDEKPLVAEFVDERPEKVKQLEAYRKNNKWKQLSGSDADVARSSKRSEIERSSQDDNSGRSYSSKKDRNDTDSDQSPPRKSAQSSNIKHKEPMRSRQLSCDNLSVVGKRPRGRHDSDSEHSPPRQQRVQRNSENDSAEKQQQNRHDSESDQSPPRKQNMGGNNSESDQSPPRKQQKGRHDSDSDQSPPRKLAANSRVSPANCISGSSVGIARHSSANKAPGRSLLQTTQQESDISPTRLKHNKRDLSPSRGNGKRGRSDSSPPRGPASRSRKDSDSSPPRGPAPRSRKDSDSSPPRGPAPRSRKDSDSSPPRGPASHSRNDSDSKGRGTDGGENSNKMLLATKTMSGASAGLQSARDMAEEARKLRHKEEIAFRNMDDEVLGRNAAAIHRDRKSGRRRDVEAENREKEESERKKKELEAKYQQWNRGLKQKEEHESNVVEAIHEMDKPLARYRDDDDLNARLKAREHADDPMLAFIKNKNNKKEAASGNTKPRYKGREPPPNRFGLWPGYRWDGVDRSSGFEKQYFSKVAERGVLKEMAHKWSVEDM